jgi:GntR family transcriptional regulator, transcriptional repressor for pyruvate dehydrogenase complex
MQPDMTNNQTLVRVERRSAAADVQSQLQALIESGRFKQHERLPSEVELARSFGVSRPVVREALMSLQALGLTASQSGKGTFVISDRVQAPFLIGHYSPAHIKEVRRALEIPSARFAALRRTDQDVGQLAALLARMEDADDPARRNKLDADYHIAIAAASAIGYSSS